MERGNQATKEKWRRIIKEHEESGLPAGKFCETRGHGFHQFRYWKQRLRVESNEVRFAPVITTTKDLTTRDVDSKATLVLMTGKLRLEIHSGFDRTLLKVMFADRTGVFMFYKRLNAGLFLKKPPSVSVSKIAGNSVVSAQATTDSGCSRGIQRRQRGARRAVS
jgi:hypothetical protein